MHAKLNVADKKIRAEWHICPGFVCRLDLNRHAALDQHLFLHAPNDPA
jgi:hypothetical protein